MADQPEPDNSKPHQSSDSSSDSADASSSSSSYGGGDAGQTSKPGASGPGPKPPEPQPSKPQPSSPSSPSSPGQHSVPLDPAWADPNNRPDVPSAVHGVDFPQIEPGDLPLSAQSVPSMVPDPFDSATMLDLGAAAVPSFNLVDGTVAIATDPQMPFVLFKGHNPNTWFYAPRWGRIAKNPDGEPAFMVTKKVRNNPDGSKTTLGGILSFMVELVVELPGEGTRQQWTNLIKTLYNINPTGGAFNFQPLRLSPGTMDVFGLDMYARPGQQLKGVEVGSSSSIAFAIELTPDGADHFAAMLGATPSPYPPQVAIMFTYRYQYLIPQCQIRASGYKKKAYDYFSWNVKARASYFGLVNGSVDYQSVRADLRQQQALNVSIVGQPPSGVDLTKLLDAIFDQFVKLEVGQWIQPDPKPVDAPAPGGFFGGVSVSMKSVQLSDTAQFDQALDFAGIGENIHQVSFNFEQQLGAFDPRKHLFVEEDDIKLPFNVLLSNSPFVKRIVPSASYTTPTGPRVVQCAAVGEEGGETTGVVQFTWPHQPTSAQMELLVDFKDPHVGYKYRETLPISDTGAAFAFYPTRYMQRTQLIFVDAALVVDPASKALLKWEWTPPVRPNEPQRPKVAGYTLVTVDSGGNANNLPTYEIVFPFHPDDWTGEAGTPQIQFKLQGLTGDWRGRETSGRIPIGETALALSFDGALAVSAPAVPADLYAKYLTGPGYRQSLQAAFGPPPQTGGPFQSGGGAPHHTPGAGYIAPSQPGQPGQPPRPGQPVMDPSTQPPYKLGFVPNTKAGELSLYGREMKAQASFAALSAKAYGASTSAPSWYDYRNVNGYNYVTPVRSQGNCGSCVSFGVTAAVEATLQVRRNNPYLNPDFSEAHLFFCYATSAGRTCGNVGEPANTGGWWPDHALNWWYWYGVADDACFPYVGPATTAHPTPACTACYDVANRVTKVQNYYQLTNADDMKSWMANGWGPLVTGYTVYQDFFDYFAANPQDSAVYRKSASPGAFRGGHCVCVIGYSDAEQAWICKNSWGEYWGAGGFFKIGYGEVGIDYTMWGVDIS
ncbi:C1 family peptidase [Streptomyces sp. NPDC058955]|uniref:C1 family peptidase n=1 Tax=unclassified Streptomyces TaxID=2593676 RepID=UPI00364BCE8D